MSASPTNEDIEPSKDELEETGGETEAGTLNPPWRLLYVRCST